MENSHVHLVRPARMNAVLALGGASPTHPPPGSPNGQRHLASRARERQPGQPIQLDPIPCLAPRLLRPMREPDAAAADAMDGTPVVPDVLLFVPAAARQFAGFGVPVPGPSAHVCAVAFRTSGFAGLQVVGGFRVREAAFFGTRLLGDGVRFGFFSFLSFPCRSLWSKGAHRLTWQIWEAQIQHWDLLPFSQAWILNASERVARSGLGKITCRRLLDARLRLTMSV